VNFFKVKAEFNMLNVATYGGLAKSPSTSSKTYALDNFISLLLGFVFLKY